MVITVGLISRFTCDSCGYEAQVSGGDDRGFSCMTTTILCKDCRELYDVETGRGTYSLPGMEKKVEPRCPPDFRTPTFLKQ